MLCLKNLSRCKKTLNLSIYVSRQVHVKKPESDDQYLVPTKPIASKVNKNLLPPRTKIDSQTIALLERLSLVDCANKKSIEVLEDAIHFADQISQVDTTGIEPLITVLEDR